MPPMGNNRRQAPMIKQSLEAGSGFSGQGVLRTMTEHKLFYYPYTSFTNAQLPLLKVAALYFDKLVILEPVGASWATIGVDHHA